MWRKCGVEIIFLYYKNRKCNALICIKLRMNTHGRRVAVGASAEGVISNTKRKLYATSLLLNFQVYRRIETMSYHSLDGWLGSRMVSLLDAGAEGPGFKSQSSQANFSHPSCLCSPSSEIGSSPLKKRAARVA